MRSRSGLLALSFILSAPLMSKAETLQVSGDLENTGTEISPLIYGQFIEHLGRCIYGGIWAEVLEDRKFYFEITEDYDPYGPEPEGEYPAVVASPWEIFGNSTGVHMVKENSFVGEHTPLIRAGSGIRQHDLGVREGMTYEGYLRVQGPGARVRVALLTPNGRDEVELRVPGQETYPRVYFDLLASEETESAVLEVEVLSGEIMLGTLSLMPADNIHGMRADTLAVLKELNSPVYRWPGGNFVSGYDWRNGVGERDRRPPIGNPAWGGVEHNDFGTDEFMVFCREIGTEPNIAVNTGYGDAYSAAQWVEYCNAGPETLGGAMRVENGNLEPYDVDLWCVGNEMFGIWQLGYMQLHHYTEKHNRVARAMRAVDPDITLVGVGALDHINEDHDPDAAAANRGWSRGMLEASADHMDWISEHFYDGRTPWSETGVLPMEEHAQLMKTNIRRLVEGHRELQSQMPELEGRIVPIALDEWNYWHRDYVYGELGCIYDLSDGLGIAIGLHEYFRNSDMVIMANYAQTVNVIGCVKTTKVDADFATTGLPLMLYRRYFLDIPLILEGGDTPPYDVMAATNAEQDLLSLGVVNPTDQELVLEFNLGGAELSESATRFLITGPSREAFNRPGQPRQVDITEEKVVLTEGITVPPMSNALYLVELN